MDLRVRKESEDSVETQVQSALLAPSVSEELLVTEDFLVLTGCQDQRELKVIVEYLDLQAQKVLLEILDVQENLGSQVQGVSLVLLEFKEQRASPVHWAPPVKTDVQALQGPLETGVLQEPWGSQVRRALMETPEKLVNKDLQECPVKEVLLGRMGRWAPPAPQVHLVLQETEESRDLQVSTDFRVCLGIKDHLENLGNQETKVSLENLAPWVRSDHGENEEFLVREENWVQLVCREPRESLVHQVQMGQRVVLVLLEPLVMWVLLVFKVCLENGASLVHLGLKATGERSVRKDQKVHLETTEPEELQVLLAR